MTNQPPDNWELLVPQNRQGHWVISNAGSKSEPYINENDKWAVCIWNRREECHYEYEFETGKMSYFSFRDDKNNRVRYAWDNQGLYYTHKNDIVDLVERIPNSPR